MSWPAEGEAGRLAADLSGLPTFDRNRHFQGYRGFGVCRDVSQVERLAARRQSRPRRRPIRREAAPADAPAKEVAVTAPRIAPNVVRFPGAGPLAEVRALETEPMALGSGEHGAFHELARQLTVRLQAADLAPADLAPADTTDEVARLVAVAPSPPTEHTFSAQAAPPSLAPASTEPVFVEPVPMAAVRGGPASPAGLAGTAPSGRLAPAVQAPARGATAGDDAMPASDDPALLDRMPAGILVYRYEELLFANRTALAWTGYPDLAALRAAGGLEALFPDAGVGALAPSAGDGRRLALATRGGERVPVEARLFAIHWEDQSAFATLLFRSAADERMRSVESADGQAKARELEALLDRVEDAVLVVDRAGAILSVHGDGRAFLGGGGRMLVGASLEILFAPDSRAGAGAQLAAVVRDGGAVSAERMVLGGNGELCPMTVTIAPVGAPVGPGVAAERMSVVLRDASSARGKQQGGAPAGGAHARRGGGARPAVPRGARPDYRRRRLLRHHAGGGIRADRLGALPRIHPGHQEVRR